MESYRSMYWRRACSQWWRFQKRWFVLECCLTMGPSLIFAAFALPKWPFPHPTDEFLPAIYAIIASAVVLTLVISGSFAWAWVFAPAHYHRIAERRTKQRDQRIAILEEQQARPKPRLVIDGWWSERQDWLVADTKEKIDAIYMANVRFRNNPEKLGPEARARGIVAHLTYYDLTGKTQLHKSGVYGRWAEAGTIRRGESINPHLPVDFEPNGIPHTLGLIMKYENDADCYVWDNYQPQELNLRRFAWYKIGVSPFRVHIELRGESLRAEWWVLIRNNGVGQGFDVEQDEPPS